MDEQIFQINQARILYYDCFTSLFVYELLLERQELLKTQFSLLEQYPLRDEDLRVLQDLKAMIWEEYEGVITEYMKVFSLPFSLDGNQPIEPYLSHYQEGCIGGKSLVQVRDLLKDSSVYLNKEFTKENEDHFGLLCMFMKHLLQQNDEEKSKEVYLQCIAPMKERLITDLRGLKDRKFYQGVGSLMESFFILEDGIYGLI